MADTDLHRLKRSELLEILLAQSTEIDRLRAECQRLEAQIAEKDKQLADRRIALTESGSIAEASLKLTRVFIEAQVAADTYVQNVKALADARYGADAGAAVQDGSASLAGGKAQAVPSASSAVHVQRVSPESSEPEPERPRGRHAHGATPASNAERSR